jgi:hypothetical protein
MIKNLNLTGDIHIDHNKINVTEKTTTSTTTNIGVSDDQKKKNPDCEGEKPPNSAIKDFLNKIVNALVDIITEIVQLFR